MKSTICSLTVLLFLCLFSNCTNSIDDNKKFLDLADALESSEVTEIRQAQLSLEDIIRPDVHQIEGEVVGFEITSTERIETDNLIVIDIGIKTDSDLESNVVLAMRKGNLQGDDSNKCYTVTCSGCSGCSVTTTDEGDGTFSYSCAEACCEMNINQKDCDALKGE